MLGYKKSSDGHPAIDSVEQWIRKTVEKSGKVLDESSINELTSKMQKLFYVNQKKEETIYAMYGDEGGIGKKLIKENFVNSLKERDAILMEYGLPAVGQQKTE